MHSIKDSTERAIFYTKVGNGSLEEIEPIDGQIKKAESYAISKGWNLDEIFVDDFPIDNICIPQWYSIKDNASTKSQKSFPPKRLLMPELVPIFKERPRQPIERTAFQKMLDYIHVNPINVLLISKLELLFDNMKDLFIFIDNELNPLGIDLQTLTGNFNIRPAEVEQVLAMSD